MSGKQKKQSEHDRLADVNKVLGHPLRVLMLERLEEEMLSPNELSKEFGEGLSKVSYHVKVLKDVKAIKPVKTEPRRGAVEHYYRSSGTLFTPGRMDVALTSIAQALADGGKDHAAIVKAVDAVLATVGRQVYPDNEGGKQDE